MSARKKSGGKAEKSLSGKGVEAQMKCLPQISQLLVMVEVENLIEAHPRPLVMQVLRDQVEQLRQQLLAGAHVFENREAAMASIVARMPAAIEDRRRGKLRRVINATGVVLNTNLGRAPLCTRALERIQEVATGYTNLEVVVDTRKRGGRMAGIEAPLAALTGAPAAYVVNNNAAAVMLALGTMAPGKEVIISRGELVEIGGSFRIPDVMEAAGVILREVGTTNRTHLRDYENAINPNTGLLLKVHQSNYAIAGFTAEVSLPELVALGKKHDLPVLVDLGSGSVIGLDEAALPFVRTGLPLPEEPTIKEVLDAGIDVVTCSGDKLLGGPQAGILLGKRPWIEAASKQPLTRALRVDKLTLAALEATLQVYLEEGAGAMTQIPVWAHLTRTTDALQALGETLLAMLNNAGDLHVSLEAAAAAVGGGALPSAQLPTVRMLVQHPTLPAEVLEQALRTGPVPIFGLLERGRLLLDLRTLHESELPAVAAAVEALAQLGPTQPHATADGE